MTTQALRLAVRPEEFPVAETNGPGMRYVLWVQGCALRCTQNCLNPELLTAGGGFFAKPAELAAAIARRGDEEEFEGVSILGGEPLDQCAALAEFLRAVRDLDLSAVVYTGHTLESVIERSRGDRGLREVLECVDILVEGPYVDLHAHHAALWRGSLNQRIVFLSPRYSPASITASLRARRREPTVSVFAESVRFGWHERLPLAVAGNLPQEEELAAADDGGRPFVSWIPELAAGRDRLLSPKGAVFRLSDAGLSTFGFQDRDLVERVLARMNETGIHVEV